jgi:ribosomal protein L37AE/L43A
MASAIQARKSNTAHRARMAELKAIAQAIVATGACPTCGAALRRNLSLAGWWQCSQLGAEGFRADASKPSCSFQTFTE